jgi:5,10-methylenetetrahydromethanopterin reductase
MGGVRPVILTPAGLRFEQLGERARIAEELGADEIWVEQAQDQRDVGIVASEYLRATRTAHVGTAVLPIYPRHPVATAQLAAALGEMSGGRFLLGLGVSHQLINEYMLGYKTAEPVRAMREYVTLVRCLLRDGVVNVEGRYFTARARYVAERSPTMPIYLAGLRPRMIRLAVQVGSGLLLYMSPVWYVRQHVIPAVHAACAEIGRDPGSFPILAIVPAYAGHDAPRQRESLHEYVASYAMLPNYRRVLEASGFTGARVDRRLLDAVTVVGKPGDVRARLDEYRAAGCTPVPGPLPGTGHEEFVETLTAVL